MPAGGATSAPIQFQEVRLSNRPGRGHTSPTREEVHMRSIRGLIVVAATLLTVSGCSASPAVAAHTTFKLDKTCTHDAAGVPTCTIVSSDIAAIPPGTVINYTI